MTHFDIFYLALRQSGDDVMVIADDIVQVEIIGSDDELEFDALQQFPVDELPSAIPAELSDVVSIANLLHFYLSRPGCLKGSLLLYFLN